MSLRRLDYSRSPRIPFISWGIRMNLKTIPFSELAKYAKKVAIKGKKQVMEGKEGDNKRSWGKWNQYPKDYSRKINDPNYPTAFICDKVPELDLYLSIIDLDMPKEDNHIALNVLKSKAVSMISSTYSVQTASGGYHVYLLSRTKPEAKSRKKLNIDYQANTGNLNGRYVITDYRWNKEGKKEYYKRLAESPKEVAIVDNIDDIYIGFLKDLEDSGYIKTAQNDLKDKIISILKPNVTKGERQYFSCCLAGYLRKNAGFDEKTTRSIIKGVFEEDEELQTRLNNVKRTYNSDIKSVKGYTYLEKTLPPKVLDELKKLTENKSSNLRKIIAQKLLKHKEPRDKEIADLINSELDLYINHQTQIYYERIEDGCFQEIDYIRVVQYCNKAFGSNQISEKSCKAVLPFITKPVKKDYNLLEFSNGLLNTNTKEFTLDKTKLKGIPKLSMGLNWNPEVEGGYLQEVFEKILDYEKDPENMELWFRIVGHAFMARNHIAKFMVVVGPSGSGKSTLTTALERIFNVSRIGTNKIVANERFTLIEMIDKDLNIDDDISNGMLRGIGFFNSVVAGHTISIEKKGVNEPVKLQNEQIPILIANGNSLPPVIGEGFDRRLALIRAPNIIPTEECDEMLQGRILEGEYDKDLEWLIYTSINMYWDNVNKPFVSSEMKEKMTKDYEFQSYPLKAAIEALFEMDWDEENSISVKEVNKYLKMWSKWAYKNNKISKEHMKPSNSQIKKAMDHAGYNQKTEAYLEDDIRTTMRVYEDIKTTPLVLFIIGELKGEPSGIDLTTNQKSESVGANC